MAFNGAATFSLRKAAARRAARIVRGGPSMGPQLFRCGKPDSSISQRWSYRPFNGAATFSLRKGIQSYGLDIRRGTFNGAATFSLRKALSNRVFDALMTSPSMGPQLFRCGKMQARSPGRQAAPLQWGRNFFVAESSTYTGIKTSGTLPSMGPQLFRCGKLRSA